jgi:hypothetical protein
MRHPSIRRFALFALSVFAAHTAAAGTALFKYIPAPDDHTHTGYAYGSEASSQSFGARYASDIAPWSPGFRTASTASNTYLVGWTWNSSHENDGFISKLEPSGGTLWTRHMKQIMGTATLGWRINDIVVANGVLYVCGTRTDSKGFVASITENGNIIDFSLIEATGLNIAPLARANAINVATINGVLQIFVTGEVLGHSMQVRQRQLSSPANTFSSLVVRSIYGAEMYYDSYVLRLDTNLAPNWGYTMGFNWSHDYGTAIAADGTGNIFVAMKFENPDRLASARVHNIDDLRKTVTTANASGTETQHYDAYHNSDFYPGSWSMVVQLSTSTSNAAVPVRRIFLPNWHPSAHQDSPNLIQHMQYHQGSLYVGGHFKRWLRPWSNNFDPQTTVASSLDGNSLPTYDIFIARLNPTTFMHDAWRLLHASGNSYLNQLIPAGDSIYIAGVSGAAMAHRGDISNSPTTSIGGSSTTHLFWAKLSATDLAPQWKLDPIEDSSSGVSIPGKQRVSGISVIGDRMMVVGSWNNGALTMGTNFNNRKTLPAPVATHDRGFVGFLRTDKSWLEEIAITINSAYGNPSPHRGTSTVATGESITATVPTEVYEDALGAIIDSSDASAIRERAVTRRICIGYQFDDSSINGTVNTVTFVPRTNTTLTFLWRTEHAIEIDSDIVDSDGLTSTAAGSPHPVVQKHWIAENEQFTAFIDGAESNMDQPGVRWRSTGYVAYGSVAHAVGVDAGTFVKWASFQDRQQTPKITVGSPGRIIYQWSKELKFTVSVNSSVATAAPRTYNDRPSPSVQKNSQPFVKFFSEFEFHGLSIEPRRLLVRADPRYINQLPRQLHIDHLRPDGTFTFHSIINLPDLSHGRSVLIDLPQSGTYGNLWFIGGYDDSTQAFSSTFLEICEIHKVDFDPANPPTGSHVKTDARELWFEPGSTVYASSAASVSSGISVLTLKGYTGAQGSIAPYQQAGVSSVSFTINRETRLTWDYARAIYPEAVAVGGAVSFATVTGSDATNLNRTKAPLAGNIMDAPTGSTWSDMFRWDQVRREVRILRPGKFTVEFENSAAPNDPADNVIVEITATWPTVPHYTHVLEAPPVDLDSSSTDEFAFLDLAYTESRAQVDGTRFSTPEPGRSVLVFSHRSGGIATGNLNTEALAVRVVNSLNWITSAGGGVTNVNIGTEILDPGHETSLVGHSGYVLTDLAPVNTLAYNRDALSGPIFAVNERFPDVGRWQAELPGTRNGLLAHYPLDELSGKLARNTVDGTTATHVSIANAANVPNWRAPGVDLLPSRQEYFQAPASAGNGITNQLTVSAWVKAYTITKYNGIITKGIHQQAYSLAINTNGELLMMANAFATDPDRVGGGEWTSQGRLPINQWQHVAVSYDGSHFRFYINGQLNGAPVAATVRFAAVNEALVIGAELPGADEFWDGEIRDARVYNRPLSAIEINELSQVTNLYPSDGDMAVAWYRVQDGIRWPFKALNYNPQWPAITDRIVIASQLGSEGVREPILMAADAQYIAAFPAEAPLWNRPNSTGTALSGVNVPYHSAIITSAIYPNQFWFQSDEANLMCFLYEGGFDAQRPLENLVAIATNITTWQNIYTMQSGRNYVAVMTRANPGTELANFRIWPIYAYSLSFIQPTFDAPNFADPIVYHQPNPQFPGFNPNEEHARVAPSFLDPSRPAVFALHRDLNRTARNTQYTSPPYVLVQYTDRSDTANPRTRMRVYRVIEEDSTTTDYRLPQFNRAYTYFYQGTAGRRLVPPYPLDLVMGGSGFPAAIDGVNVAGRIAYYEDKNSMPWVVSGDADSDVDIRVAWHYFLPADFWHPTAAIGEPVPYGELTTDRPRNVAYDSQWPDPVATIKAGETVTFAGGEYATDRAGDSTPPPGLPQAAAWQTAKLVFDSTNPLLNSEIFGTHYLARVVQALEPFEVELPLTSIPESLQPASGNVIVEGLLWRFKELPASLQERIYYNTSTTKLGVRGLLNGRILGDSDLLVAPGAQTILQPNLLTATDEAIVKSLSNAAAWLQAVDGLAALSRNPDNVLINAGPGIGLERVPDALQLSRNATAFGPGAVVITNPALQDPATAATLASGYITIAENDDPAFGTPVAIHVLRVSREKYRGSIAVLQPGNVFDEKLSLQHTADFAGNVADLYFQWFYREEDGRDLNPPNVSLPTHGTPLPGDWTPFAEGPGLNTVQMAGSGPVLIRDNLFFARYRHKDDTASPDWSAYAGAANSREPDPASPSAATDAAYVAQLAPGWIKRVTNAINLFDARIRDFRNHGIPATYTSMLQIAGQRHEGAVAFNPDKDAIESVGLIELYQTVLNRAKDMTIAESPGSDGVNTALLNAANRIAGLYTMFGNEAYADALDPTIGFATVGYDSVGGNFGTLNPTIHAFQNVVPTLLDEELALLRGRGEVGARPAYNRLMWNFTNGPGEAAYVMNYSIQDLDNDGFITDADARRLYPQGHGDAWGHYTMALKGYYHLARLDNFAWSPRSEKFGIDGVVLDVDYLDERAFAKTAALRAQIGAATTDLTYQKFYTENPAGQWQGYRDVDTDRAWGVFETAQRTGMAALCDWVVANALLPAEVDDPLKTGIRRVDRTTVVELALIAQQATRIQLTLDKADKGLNPSGLDPNTVPFDIDPALVTGSGGSHFEQIHARAVAAINNAAAAFAYANGIRNELRQTESTSEQLRQQAQDQDRALRNQLIQIFGTPYSGMIGPGKAYPTGYKGPDLYLYAYVDQVSAGGDVLDGLPDTVVETTIVPGLRNLATDSNPFNPLSTPIHNNLRDIVSNYFPADIDLPEAAVGEISLNLPRRASGYALVAPANWGMRGHPGEFQAAIQELVHAEWRVRMAVNLYESQADDFQNLLRKFELKSGIAAQSLEISSTARNAVNKWTEVATGTYAAAFILNQIRESIGMFATAITEMIPEVVGTSTSAGSPAKGGSLVVAASVDAALRIAITPLEIARYRAELEINKAMAELEIGLLTLERRAEIVEILSEIHALVNQEGDLRAALIDTIETMRAASDRVRQVLGRGFALVDDRIAFNTRVASTTTLQRYQDYTFRVFHNEAIRKYESAFQLAQRYAYLAAKAYDYELNLPDNHPANPRPLLGQLMRERALGILAPASTHTPGAGLSGVLATLKTNFDTLKSQMGILDPANEIYEFSLRAGLSRTGLGSRVNADWRTVLEGYRVPDLWNYQFTHNGVNYGYVFRRYCRPFAAESAGAQPALVIPFTSTIEAGKNWFGHALEGGDSTFNPTYYSTKIRSVGIRIKGYNNTVLSHTPQAYLVPVGTDRMYYPQSPVLDYRSWNVVDQRIPAPLTITATQLADPDWQPYSGSTSGFFEEMRKFSSFRVYHDAGGWTTQQMLVNGRHIGRSVWNTQWVLIIPSVSLRSDSNNAQSGIDTFIYGTPLSGFNQQTAGTVNRDLMGVQDIQLLIQAYSISGN